MGLKIQSMKQLKAEMLAVAKGTRQPPVDAGQMSFDSVEAVMRLLTPDNRQLLAVIENSKPASVADLARLVGRAESNVSRTLSRLVAGGFVRLKPGAGKAKVPEVAIHRLTVDIDVCRFEDRVAVA
ncbi:MarR family transcriptional regulator [Sulfuritalea sp.]|uniref:HVO_A0114 family putative DNA-binding protein n=1 Tax=Sulfuritalea sp. TaxID=2480090 RepID=UPI00286DB775|nr:MarR family transcriptional regulator [Sulfuritalea sp.]